MSSPAPDGPQISLLYVDDEPALLEIARLFLERTGNYSVTTCDSAEEALKILPEYSFDAIISDYQMPGCDGISFLKHLRKAGDTTPFIIFTGKGREDVVIQALNEGADFYLQKGGDPKSQFAELSNKVLYAVTRKQSEELVKESEKRLYDIIQFLPDPTFAIDSDGIVIAWNHAIEEMTGIKEADMVGKGNYEYSIPFYGERRPILIDLVSISDEELLHSKYADVTRDGDILIAETSLARPLGKYAVLFGKASPLYNEDGKVVGAIESIRDITDRKAAEEALWENEERYRAIFEHTEAPTVILEEDTTISLANSAFAEISGYSQEEMIGRSWTEFVSKPDLKRMIAFHRQRREEGADPPTHYEFSFINRYGDARFISVTVGMIPGTTQSVASFHDLTGVKLAEIALRESEEQYRRIVDTSAEGIWQLDAQFRITYVNRRMAEMLGYAPEEIIGKDAATFIPPDEQADSELRRKRVRRGEVDHFERRYIRKDGSSLWAQVAITPIVDAEGKYQGSFAMVTDMSEQRAAEEALRESEERSTAILDTLPDLMFIFSRDGRYLDYHASDKSLLKIEPEFFLGKSVLEVLPEEIAELFLQSFEQVYSTDKLHIINYSLDVPGGLKHFEARITAMEQQRLIALIRDITERKLAEESLLMKTAAIDSAINGIAIADLDGILTYVNPAFLSIWGYEELEEVLGRSVLDFSMSEQVAVQVDQEIQKKGTWSGEIEGRRKDGSPIPLELQAGIVRDASGAAIAMMGSFIDITERKTARLELEINQHRLEGAMEMGDLAWWEMDCQSGEVTFSDKKAQILGYSPDSFTHYTDFTALLHPDDYETAMQAMRDHLEGKKLRYEVKYRIQKADGDYLWFRDVGGVSERDQDGKPLKVVGLIANITWQKDMEDALRRSEENYKILFEPNFAINKK